MREERFSLRYGYEQKPDNPIFDEAPKRLRFFIVQTLQKRFQGPYHAMQIVSEAVCRPELIGRIHTPFDLWNVLFPLFERWAGWEIYNLIEPMHAELATEGKYNAAIEFENELNQTFAEESIGWRLKGGKLERTLPAAAREQVDAVFKELGNPRFDPALTHVIAAHKAYNGRPQRGYDACSNAFDACESVAKEIFRLPNGTFGDVLKEAKNKNSFASETVSTLEKLYALSNNHFRHGMTEPFALKPSEVDFVYLTCFAGVLLFVRLL